MVGVGYDLVGDPVAEAVGLGPEDRDATGCKGLVNVNANQSLKSVSEISP